MTTYVQPTGLHPSYLRGVVNFNDTGVATGIELEDDRGIPAGSFHLATYVHVKTAFNAASTNVLVVGTAADDDAFVTASDVAEGSVAMTRVNGKGLISANTIPLVKYTQSGPAATAGVAEIVFEFVAPE
jgi:hypothetical protein